MARIDFQNGVYVGLGTFEEKALWKAADFTPILGSKPVAWAAPTLDHALRVPSVVWTEAAIAAMRLQKMEAEDSLEMSFAGSTEFQPPLSDTIRAKGWNFKPFQRAGVEYALLRKDTLVGDQPGLGKTIQAVGVANSMGVLSPDAKVKRVLVVAPASLKINWKREWEAWQTTGLSVGVAEASFTERQPDGFFKNGKAKFKTVKITDFWPDTDVVIINYEILERFTHQINAVPWDLLVCDECHALKSSQSIRTLFIIGGMQKPDRKKDRPKPIFWQPVHAKKRVFLSGTPMLNRPYEFWPIVSAFDPDDLGKNEEAYIRRYCGGFMTHFGLDSSGATNLPELGEKLRAKFMVRRMKRDVLPELPPKTRVVVPLDSKEIRELVAKEDELAQSLRLYEEMVRRPEGFQDVAEFEAFQGDIIAERAGALNLRDALGNGEEIEPNWRYLDMDYARAVSGLEPPAVAVAFEEIALVRRELGIAKLSAVIPWVKTFLDGGEKLVLFGYHSTVVEMLIDALKAYEPAYIYGKVPQRRRQDMVDRFQLDEKCRVIIGNIHAMGVGHTLVRAHDVAFAEGDWTPALIEQAEDRVCRIGQLSDKIFAYFLVANGSLDAKIAQSAARKERNIEKTIG